METKHTPGPWGIEQTDNTSWIGPMRSDGEKINEIVTQIDREGLKPAVLDRHDADAKLIAAAPELLNALQWIIDHPFANLQMEAGDKARAAIAKATGGQP